MKYQNPNAQNFAPILMLILGWIVPFILLLVTDIEEVFDPFWLCIIFVPVGWAIGDKIDEHLDKIKST